MIPALIEKKQEEEEMGFELINVSETMDFAARTEKATFGAGNFWSVESAFQRVEGVVSTRVGYMGGTLENPTYQDVCEKNTGHAQVVEVVYDPAVISYERLLEVFWEIHNPTALNQQGKDVGYQFRSVIFYHNLRQAAAAKLSKEKLEWTERFTRPIVTQIVPAGKFYPAEEYHQRYLERGGPTVVQTR